MQKVISLVKKTGDRLVVYDPNNKDNIFVIMSIEEYEKLIIGKSEVRNLTEDELLDKINRDIAIWKSEQEDYESEPKSFLRESDFFTSNKEKRPEWDMDWADTKQEKFEYSDAFDNNQDKNKHRWGIPSERKKGAEEVIIEEDRQYLEEIND